MDRGGRRSMSWSPPKWRTQALRDEDVKRCIQAAKRLGSLTTQPSDSENINGFRSHNRNAALHPVKLENNSAEPQIVPKRREEHLHVSGWQDPICSLFQNGSGWKDPTCTVTQTFIQIKNLAASQAKSFETGGSCSLATPPETPCKGPNESFRMTNLKNGDYDASSKEKELKVASKSSQEHHRSENVFRDMGFPPALIQRAIQLHGAQADYSIILQFLLDWRKNKDVRGASCKKQVDQREIKLPNKGPEENVFGSVTIRQQIADSIRKIGAEKLWDSDDSDYSDSDFDNEDEEAMLPASGSPINLAKERGSDHPVSLCKRERPAGEDHHRLMRNQGFPAELVERAIQELGEGVEYDMLLEYLLYLTAQQDPKASTSAVCERRASAAKKLVNECSYPPKRQQRSCKNQVSTVEKLVAECGYKAKSVERAIAICDTPLWNAEQDQIADLVDFLTAHMGELNESEDDAKEDENTRKITMKIQDENPLEDIDWSWVRQHTEEDVRTSSKGKRKLGNGEVVRRKTINRLTRPQHIEDASASGKGKRKLGHGGVARRKTINRLSRPSHLKREQFDHPPLTRPSKVKLEHVDELEELDEPPLRRRPKAKLQHVDELEEFGEPPLRRRSKVKLDHVDELEELDERPLRRRPKAKLQHVDELEEFGEPPLRRRSKVKLDHVDELEELDERPLRRRPKAKLQHVDELEEFGEPPLRRRSKVKLEHVDELEELDERPLRRRPKAKLQHVDELEEFGEPPLRRRSKVKLDHVDELEELDEPPLRRRPKAKLQHVDELEEFDEPSLKRRPKVKRQYFDQPFVSRRQSSSRVPRVKLGAPQRRNTPVGRMGRPKIMKEEAYTAVERHKGSVGFGLPGFPVKPRYLDEDVKGAPFFYFENVASMPNDEWDRIRRHLFDIEPEFVDSLHFSACRRPRGYIHNLPIEGRRKILPDPAMTIQELMPHTKPFWPAWDPRTKLNCITTRMGSEFLIKKLRIGDGTSLQAVDPSPDHQREILHLCRHWNLVWTAPNIPTPIDETEIEAMLGFDAGHTRNILSNRARYKALGNSFSVYTVAFHFSVLKPLYPRGIKVLSLFSGIGGAEVALHKMGIKLLVVVSVEIDDGTRRCLEAWWAASKQTGVLNQNYHNIKDLGRAQISELVNMYSGFDLVVGGTPCNNLSGSNHVTRIGLDGKQSAVFFEFSRVVAAVRELTIRLKQSK